MLVRVGTAAPAEGAIRGGSHREQTPANAHNRSMRHATFMIQATFKGDVSCAEGGECIKLHLRCYIYDCDSWEILFGRTMSVTMCQRHL